jgi:hypothetical protein
MAHSVGVNSLLSSFLRKQESIVSSYFKILVSGFPLEFIPYLIRGKKDSYFNLKSEI